MAQDSRIGWTDNTWNPWQGCHKVGPGCAHCYMFAWQARYGKPQDVVIRSAPATFRLPLQWHRQLIKGVYQGKRHGATVLVFTCSSPISLSKSPIHGGRRPGISSVRRPS